MPASNRERSDRNGPQGCLRVKRTVDELTAVTFCTAVRVQDQAAAGLRARLMQKATSLAVIGFPFWNVVPGRRVNVYALPPLDILQLVARSGTMVLPSGPTRTNLS